MTVGELREQLNNIDYTVEIDFIINTKCPEDDRYDITAELDIMRSDVANEEGYIEFLITPKQYER